ncbi:MAG: FAD-dependent oxidoreductase [Pseudomonadota bacterium]
MSDSNLFAAEFQESPYWWEAYQPDEGVCDPVPRESRVAIVGAGYAGLAAALELARHGIEATVFDAEAPGFGASTRSGGLVDGLATIKKPLRTAPENPNLAGRIISDTADALSLLDDLIEGEGIDCEWTKSGRFIGAWTRKDFRRMQASVERLTTLGVTDVQTVPHEAQSAEIGSELYRGGLAIGLGGHLHPARYFQGLLQACRKRSVTLCGRTAVTGLSQENGAWQVKTERGELRCGDVIIATNGHTGDLTPQFRRRLVPVQPYIIATTPLPDALARELSPRNRGLSDSKRVLTFFRLAGDPPRMVFGSRVKWRDTTATDMAPSLHRLMLERFPQLEGTKITHAWNGKVAVTFDERPHMGRMTGLHYALGCNGSGVAMMTFLGTLVAQKIARQTNALCAFDTQDFPGHPLYSGGKSPLISSFGTLLRMRDWADRRLDEILPW